MASNTENIPRRPFWTGFVDVFGRTFSLDFSPRPIPLPQTAPDPRPGWEIDAENLRRDWENVGGYFRTAVTRVEAENPSLTL